MPARAPRLRAFPPLAAALLLVGAGSPPPTLPADAAILPEAEMGAVLQQCSRGVPGPPQGAWTPAAGDILALERLLPDALQRQRATGDGDWRSVLATHRRQYVGLVRGGRRFIYGNFYPRSVDAADKGWTARPVSVCDGGPTFFGVEYDVAAGRFTHMGFNGSF